jgi:predicted amidohydrolase
MTGEHDAAFGEVMSKTLRRSIAVAQTCPVKGDVNANIAEHLRLAALAASEGAQVVVFPELSLTGYEIGLADKLAFSQDDSRLVPLIEAASSHSIIIIVGAPVRIETRLHIAAFILCSDRMTILYTKHHLGAFGESACQDGSLPPAEATVFQTGDRNPLLQFGGRIAAVAICADIGQPSHPQQAADRGARAYLASMFVIPSDFEADSAKLSRYARQHCMVVALSNFGSPTGGLAAAGRSSIWSETGDLLVQLEPSGSGVAVATETSKGWLAKEVMLESRRPATSELRV